MDRKKLAVNLFGIFMMSIVAYLMVMTVKESCAITGADILLACAITLLLCRFFLYDGQR